MEVFNKKNIGVLTIIVMLMNYVESDIVLNVTFVKHSGSIQSGNPQAHCTNTSFGVYPSFRDVQPKNYSMTVYSENVVNSVKSWTGIISFKGDNNFLNVVNRTMVIESSGSTVKKYLWIFVRPKDEECTPLGPEKARDYVVWFNNKSDFRNISQNKVTTINILAKPNVIRHRLELHIEVHCAVNFYGNFCNTSCLNNTSLHYHCDEDGIQRCNHGYRVNGSNCVEIDECLSSPCKNNGTCQDEVNNYTCACISGFTGFNCIVNIDDCPPNSCENNGTCQDGVNSYTCACLPGFTGFNCSVNIDDCPPNPCENNGTCQDGVNSYTCACLPGFTGFNCSVNIDDCPPNPCENNGTCQDGVNSYTCACLPGFTGFNCSVNIDDCPPNPCENNGTCQDGVNSYTCACLPGFTGFNCSVNIDDCPPNPCENNGTCQDGVNSFTCACIPGFTGFNCSVNIDDCQPKPCENNGTCHDGVNSFTCNCSSGFTGLNCSVNIDDCVSTPCQNNCTGKKCEDKPKATTRFPTSQRPPTSAPNPMYIAAGSSAGVVVLIIIVATIICIKKRRRKPLKEGRDEDYQLKEEQDNVVDTYKDNPMNGQNVFRIYDGDDLEGIRRVELNKLNGETTNTKDLLNNKHSNDHKIIQKDNPVNSENLLTDSYFSRL